jgi:peptide/nickel transport system substrate-binding protein
MHGLSQFRSRLSLLLGLGCALTLLLAVACGAAAPATPAPAKAAQPPAPAAPAAKPAAPAAPAATVPSPAPVAKPAPAAAVHPGKLTLLIGGFGNERFDFTYGVGGGNNYARLMQGFLIASTPKAELIPGIASKWDVSADGKTWTFTIRDGVKFHNGQTLTADDIYWTLQHYFGPGARERATNGKSQSVAANSEKVLQTGPTTVTYTSIKPDAGFGEVISEASADWFGVFPKREKVYDDALEAAYDKNPVGVGPMRLTRHVTASQMQFERFADYYYQPANGFPEDRRVKFTTLDLRLVPEEATRVAAIRAGEADIAPASLASRKQIEASGGRMVFGAEGVYITLAFKVAWDPAVPFSKKQVRQALGYALDLKVFQDKLFGAEVFTPKGWSYVTPSSLGYSPDLDPFPYDPNKARQLLAEAGYPGGRGFGKLVLNTWVSTAIPFLPESAQLAAEFWKRELGLDVEVKVGDEAANKRCNSTEGCHRGETRWIDNEARRDGASITRSSFGTLTVAGRHHEDPAIYKLVDETLAVIDPAKRHDAWNKVYKVLKDEQYQMGIGYINIPWAVAPRVVTWEPFPLSFYPSGMHTVVLK